MRTRTRRSFVAADRPIADHIGTRLRAERLRAGLTQSQLAGERYTKAYVSALEHGLAKPSMAALTYLAGRLGVEPAQLLGATSTTWTRLEADLLLASGDWQRAADAYHELLETEPNRLTRAELLRGRAEALCRLDLGSQALAPAAEAAAIFTELRRTDDAFLAMYWQAFAHHQLEQAGEAQALLRTMLDQVRAGVAVEPDFKVRLLIAYATAESREGRINDALGHLEEARAGAEALDDRKRAAFLLTLAFSYREAGDIEAAVTVGRRSLALFEAAEATLETSSLANELALAYLALANTERAAAYAEEAHRGFERLSNERWLAHVLDTEAQIALAKGEVAAAGDRAREAQAAAERSGNRKAYVSAGRSLAKAQRAAGQLAAAIETLAATAQAARETGRGAQLRDVLTDQADALAEVGDIESAYRLTREALELSRR